MSAPEEFSGSIRMLEESGRFSSLHADSEFGIFAIGIDQTAPDFPSGKAILFSGDDGNFRTISNWFEAEKLDELNDACLAASNELDRLDTSQNSRISRRQYRDRNPPTDFPDTASLQRHPGTLFVGELFAMMLSEITDDRLELALLLRSAHDHWNTIMRCSARWIDTIPVVVSNALNPLRDQDNVTGRAP
jgi:hypothetical protein